MTNIESDHEAAILWDTLLNIRDLACCHEGVDIVGDMFEALGYTRKGKEAVQEVSEWSGPRLVHELECSSFAHNQWSRKVQNDFNARLTSDIKTRSDMIRAELVRRLEVTS